LNFIKSDGVERPFEPASKVPNVVAQRGATKEGPFHGEDYHSGFGFGQVDLSSSRHRRKRESQLAKRGLKVPLWIRTMLQRRPVKVVSVALANKIARTIWALLVRGGVYQAAAAMLKT